MDGEGMPSVSHCIMSVWRGPYFFIDEQRTEMGLKVLGIKNKK